MPPAAIRAAGGKSHSERVHYGWTHGYPEADPCEDNQRAEDCEQRRGSGTLSIRRAVQQQVWKHGCSEQTPCEHRYGTHCPQRHSGGPVITDVKSRAGRRTVGIPHPVPEALERQRMRQQFERERARQEWEENGFVFTNHWEALSAWRDQVDGTPSPRRRARLARTRRGATETPIETSQATGPGAMHAPGPVTGGGYGIRTREGECPYTISNRAP